MNKRYRDPGDAFSHILGAAAAALAIVCLGDHASGATITQTFDSEESAAAAGWTAVNTTGTGNNYGWASVPLTGTTGGSAGGAFARSTADPLRYYADTSLGGTLSRATDSLFMSGKLSLTNNNLDGGLVVGFFDTTKAGSTMEYVGIGISEPASGGATGSMRSFARFRTGSTTDPNPPTVISLTQNTTHSFELTWTPAGTDGSGTLTWNIAGTTGSAAVGAGSGVYDAFGVFNNSAGSSTTAYAEAYFDDLTYTVVVVPEPSAGLALLAGSLPVLVWQAKRRRGGDRTPLAMSATV